MTHRTVTRPVAQRQPSLSSFASLLLLLLPAVLLVAAQLSIFACKVAPREWTQHHYLTGLLASDDQYMIAIPLLAPLSILGVYANWLGLKLYRHN